MINFKSVKSLVTAREAAEHYGLTVNSHGMALCPNCHRKMHMLNDPNDISILKSKVL